MAAIDESKPGLKQPYNLSPRIKWLRDYYFQGTSRKWNNEFTSWTTGTPWDVQFQEMTYYIVPEVYFLMQTLRGSYRQGARNVGLDPDFWNWSLPERRAWFVRKVMVDMVPQEILPGDLICGGRFNVQTSLCLNRREAAEYDALLLGPGGARATMKRFHDHGYGNSGATSGHLVPGYERMLKIGWRGIFQEIQDHFAALPESERAGSRGQQLRAMMTAATMPRDVGLKYAQRCRELAAAQEDEERRGELLQMARNLDRVPWEPPTDFWQALQALWLGHMLVMSDENYPGPGVSFGRFDQYMLPYWEKSIELGMDREFGKELLKCFWVHCNTAYDAQIRSGNQGITAGFGQLITLSGMGDGGRDMTNDFTYVVLEVIDEMSPILEPKPNVRLHRGTPPELMDKVVQMVSDSQGAPFLLNFDERSMAGMLRQAELAGQKDRINLHNVYDYAPVGCLENTMVGNDRSGTVDNNLNLVKAVELAMNGGRDLLPYVDQITGVAEPVTQDGPDTGDATAFRDFQEFWTAYERQTAYIIDRCAVTYEASESVRARFFQTPYLSCLVAGCAAKGRDINQGGADINLTTLEAVTFATTVDSLLAIKYLVFDRNICTMQNLIDALRANWVGHEVLQAQARNKAPKYGRDDDQADDMAVRVMNLWCDGAWKHVTKSTGRRFRPGMLSWNYWAGDGYVVVATPDGRPRGQFLSNAICPSNGADINGPTSNSNSVGKALGGKSDQAVGNFQGYVNLLPNGASHTITFHPAVIQDPEHRDKFKSFLYGYMENGGTALQINILDPDMLRMAQKHPQDYRHLLVRVTGYNAYFVSIGRELQDEVIARMSHQRF